MNGEVTQAVGHGGCLLAASLYTGGAWKLTQSDVHVGVLPLFHLAGIGLLLAVPSILAGFGVPVPEDVTLIAGGIIAGLGYADVRIMCAVGLAGVLVGDSSMFLIGRHLGTRYSHQDHGKPRSWWPGERHHHHGFGLSALPGRDGPPGPGAAVHHGS